MTVIAVFKVNGCPIIIGDILITSSKKTDIDVPIPATGKLSSELESINRAVMLVQKVTKINEHLMIAWSGNFVAGQTFVIKLKEELAQIRRHSWRRTRAVINRLCDQNDEIKSDDSFSFVLIYKDHRICVTSGGGKAVNPGIDSHDGLVVAGSGKDALIEYLQGVEFGNMTNRPEPAFKTLDIISRMWAIDLVSQNSIKYGSFGGGYEIGTLVDNELTKMGDILLANAFATPEGFGIDGRLTKIDYLHEYLFIRVMYPEFVGEPLESFPADGSPLVADAPRCRKIAYIICPIDSNTERMEWVQTQYSQLDDMNAEWTSVLLSVKRNAENDDLLSLVLPYHRPARNGPIVIKDNGNEIFWEPAIIKRMLEEAQEFILPSTES